MTHDRKSLERAFSALDQDIAASPPDLDRLFAPGDSAPSMHDHHPIVVLTSGADLNPEPVSWLWPNWLALGKLHVLAGMPGQGKTTIAAGALAATVTVGGRWPDGEWVTEPGNVVIWSGEDDPADTLLPRFIASGGDRNRVFFVEGTRRADGVSAFDPSTDLPHLEAELERIGNVRLLVVDPVVSAVTGDGNSNNVVRRSLQPLVDLAAKCRCAVLGISHFSKGGAGNDPAQRVVGSIAFAAVARVVLVAAKVKQEDGDDRRILARSKSNIGPDDGGVRYDLRQVEALPGIYASRVEWMEQVEGSARELLADAAEQPETSRDGASDFLLNLLQGGPIPSATVKSKATTAGHAWRTIERASKDLDIEKRKHGMDGGWYWSLPKNATKNAKNATLGEWRSSGSSVAEFANGAAVPTLAAASSDPLEDSEAF